MAVASPTGAEHAYDVLAPFYDDFTAHHDYESWARDIEVLATAHGLSGRRLLDLACGTGKSFLPFLGRGYDVTALDVSAGMLAIAAAKADGRARLCRGDLRTLQPLGRFDLVTCLDDAVNYLLDPDELTACFAGVAANLDAGGLLVFDVNSLWCYRAFFATATVVPGERRVLVWNGEADADFGAGDLAEARLDAFTLRDDGFWDVATCRHRQRHHPGDVLAEALTDAGLDLVARYGLERTGRVRPHFDEDAHSKALYIARPAHDA